MRAYALADLGDRLAVDVYLRRDHAFAELESSPPTSTSWVEDA
jgi:hypothetical protein